MALASACKLAVTCAASFSAFQAVPRLPACIVQLSSLMTLTLVMMRLIPRRTSTMPFQLLFWLFVLYARQVYQDAFSQAFQTDRNF